MKQLDKVEKNNMLYIMDFQGLEENITIDELKTIVRETVLEKSNKYKPIMGEEKYKEYEESVSRYILNPSNPVNKRKEVYQAINNELLIGGLA